ncbi:hypothetical protein DOTSEDRAFT_128286 [Dothistroma septosporum NZE10]|uniref:Uncharacterized protein n=1 Tax=Dothistroma septosporum (strain NZE10 / CBS 128990) TaxID=675120 RepID=N1PTM3_DOTSN|nr:hypothetical protein DOTSEDRAFT_128286 [Dothistroma septosporum NZE10]
MPPLHLVIVTGANRGIGKAICQQILRRPGVPNLKLFATSRSGDDLGLESDDVDKRTLYRKLDVTDQDSIENLRDEAEESGEVSVLINNAGVNLDKEYSSETARKTMEVNYWGSLRMCQTFLPHLTNTGRIVNLSSVASSLKPYSAEVQERFRTARDLQDLEALAEDYLHSVQNRSEEAAGFFVPPRPYAISKALVRGMTRVLSHQHREAHPGSKVLINCCCPGWIHTDMGALVGSARTKAPKSADEGASIVNRLAFDDLRNVTGEHWANDSVRSRELGKVQEW